MSAQSLLQVIEDDEATSSGDFFRLSAAVRAELESDCDADLIVEFVLAEGFMRIARRIDGDAIAPEASEFFAEVRRSAVDLITRALIEREPFADCVAAMAAFTRSTGTSQPHH